MNRPQAIAAALRRIAPALPDQAASLVVDDALAAKGLRRASPEAAAWLALVSYARHRESDYDALLAEGYDRASARHFSKPAIDAALAAWGCRLRAGEHEAEEDG